MIQLEISFFMASVFIIFHIFLWLRWFRSEHSVPVEALSSSVPSTLSVSFLVPAWNASDAISKFVASFHQLDIQDKQLVLCVGGPDGSYEVAKKFEANQIIVFEQTPGMGKQRALQVSLPKATGEVIFLTDIDCELHNDIVNGMLCQISDTRTVVTGGIRPLQTEHTPLVTLQWAIRRCSAPRTRCETNGLLGANTAMLKSTLDAVGGFSVPAPSGTDYTLAKEVTAKGHRIWYIPNCEMATEFPDTLKTYIHKQSRWLRNVLVIGPKYRAWSELRAILITLLLPYIYSILLIAGFFFPVLWVLVVLLLLHGTLNRLHYVSIWHQRVPVHAAFLSIVADLAAATRASFQSIFRKYTW